MVGTAPRAVGQGRESFLEGGCPEPTLWGRQACAWPREGGESGTPQTPAGLCTPQWALPRPAGGLCLYMAVPSTFFANPGGVQASRPGSSCWFLPTSPEHPLSTQASPACYPPLAQRSDRPESSPAPLSLHPQLHSWAHPGRLGTCPGLYRQWRRVPASLQEGEELGNKSQPRPPPAPLQPWPRLGWAFTSLNN